MCTFVGLIYALAGFLDVHLCWFNVRISRLFGCAPLLVTYALAGFLDVHLCWFNVRISRPCGCAPLLV